VWPEPVERVARQLRGEAVEATIQEFPEGTLTAEDAARAIGCRLDQVVKSVVFVCDIGPVMALVPGDRRADEGLVAAAVQSASIRVAYAREVVALTGFELGAVAPFPLVAIERVLLERTILQHARVWIGAGSPTHMAGLSPAELQHLSGAETADILAPR
jgi:prolyl-tRNA editing enzyme YbaK/EbsC (Cys-tRNA(Pro) deacylase)